MAEIYRFHGGTHEDIQALLPWYVNGTLTPKELARVETHLSECADCRAELESEHSLAQHIATLPLNVEHGWSAMKQRMTADSASHGPSGRPGFLRRRVTIGWAIAVPVAAVAAVVLMFMTIPIGAPQEQTYHALGSPGGNAQGNLVVLFKPDSTEQQMRQVLTANDARLVDGPTTAGAYVLQVDDARRDTVVRQLHRSEHVMLAEPIEPPGRQ